MPDVSVDSQGHISVVWTSFGQDNAEVGNPSVLDYGIYTRMYNEKRLGLLRSELGTFPLEFRVNATTLGNQTCARRGQRRPQRQLGRGLGGARHACPKHTTAIYSRVIDPPGASPAKAPGSRDDHPGGYDQPGQPVGHGRRDGHFLGRCFRLAHAQSAVAAQHQ